MGTTGGNTADMIEALELTAAGRIDPAVMVTHIGGLDAAAETTCNLPKIPGGKKLIYTHIEMPLIALTDLRTRADEDPRYAGLADIVEANNGLWSPCGRALPARKLVGASRIYGGARSVEEVVGTDGLLSDRSLRNVSAKRQIAEKAAALVRPNTSIYLDSGSTTTALAARMPDVPMLVFTNSLTVATELARLERPQVVMVGGTLNRYSMSLAGGRAVDGCARSRLTRSSSESRALSVSTGFSCGSDEEARLKRAVSERAHQVIALMDSSKASRRSTFSFCDLERADVLVSDGALPEKDLAALAAANVTVL